MKWRSTALILGIIVLALFIFALGTFTSTNIGTGPTRTNSTSSTTHTLSTLPVTPRNYSLWLTYHRDNSRAGFDTAAGPGASVHPGWTSPSLDGAIYAEPLVVGGEVIIATENNTVYALNDSTGQVMWQAHLGAPVPRSDLPCGDINPTGITSTPVIDASARTIYTVAFLRSSHQHWLFALDLSTGATRISRSADPSGADPLVEQQRGALSLSNGLVYVPYGGLFGDCGDYHGWVVGIPANGTGALLSYQVPTGRGGGVWAPSGAAIDAEGDLLVATGNSFSSSVFDFGDAVIKLSPSLQRLDWFAPSNWVDLNNADADLGSVGPSLLDSKTIFQIGKDGVGYLVNASHLGGFGGHLFSSKVCNAAFGGTAYRAPYLYVPCTDGLVALRVNLGASRSFTIAWKGPTFHAEPPILAGGAVWLIDRNGGDLYGLNATSGQTIFRFHLGAAVHFSTPSSGDGEIFVAAGNKILSFIVA